MRLRKCQCGKPAIATINVPRRDDTPASDDFDVCLKCCDKITQANTRQGVEPPQCTTAGAAALRLARQIEKGI